MKKRIPYTKQPDSGFKCVIKTRLFVLLIFISHLTILAQTDSQETITVHGTVTEAEFGPVTGANIIQQGTVNGVMTDLDGTYTIKVPVNAKLEISYIGFATQVINVNGRTEINIVMVAEASVLDEVVVIGYGKQKKESVVGSIVQVSGTVLESGGVPTVGQALTGRLPGVVTVSSTGRPGDENPSIYIRGQSSWNGGGQPLILVDGIERSMNDVNASDIESMSVLKDASATAVFGVKGGNGVILITTKRGKKGKAQLSVSASSTIKVPSKLPEKYDSYNGIMATNEAIERVVSFKEELWPSYTPVDIVDRYRNPRNETDRYIYPNVDWKDVIQKDFAMDHKVNLSVSGGTDAVKYFGALTYQHVGDIFNGSSFDNGRGYSPNFNYDRFNFRSNIDFDITSSTRLSVNLSGHYGIQNGNEADRQLLYSGIYNLAPSLFYPIYPDGTFGRLEQVNYELQNPAVLLATKGATKNHRVQVNSDFKLTQKLDFITEGLALNASLSYDNNFRGASGIKEPDATGSDNVIYTVYNPDGSKQLISATGTNQFDYVIQPWKRDALQIQDWQTSRRLFYLFSLNYDNTFAEKHNVSLLALMNREEYAIGNMVPRYREDWVGRLVYNYDNRYFVDINGAYNGSEKYGPGHKFQLFPSAALGWMVSNESFMENVTWLNKLKIRGSYGVVGDDAAGKRWAYVSQWGSGGSAYMNNSNIWDQKSPYTYYKESAIGNPNLEWETSEKANIGFELAVLDNMFSVEADYFQEDRHGIIISDRSVPSFLGFAPADVNLGETSVKGLEVALNFKHRLTDNWDVSANFAYTTAKDKVLYREDPELKEAYQKYEGYPIGQHRTIIRGNMMQSWDDVYGSSPLEDNQEGARPGSYDMIDYNGDGVINSNDNVPYGYPTRPQNTYNLTLGAGYKDFSFSVQFYGVSNTTKEYSDRTFAGSTPLFFDEKSDYWSVNNPNGTEILPSYGGAPGGIDPYRNWYDASFVRLQNMELAYTFGSKNDSQYRVFLSGNNLAFWSDLPDDREENVGNQSEFRGNYPTFKRMNLGVTINF